DKGVIFDRADGRATTPSGAGSTELFICRLPSRVGVIATAEEAEKDDATVVAKLMEMSPREADPAAAAADPPELIVCSINGGPPFAATKEDCLAQGGTVVQKPPPEPTNDTPFLYQLPSGNEAVGTYTNFLADRGSLVEAFDARVTTPT